MFRCRNVKVPTGSSAIRKQVHMNVVGKPPIELLSRDVRTAPSRCLRCCPATAFSTAPNPPAMPLSNPALRAQHAMLLFGPAMLMIEAENPEVPTRPSES
jgi:hypothetical protein